MVSRVQPVHLLDQGFAGHLHFLVVDAFAAGKWYPQSGDSVSSRYSLVQLKAAGQWSTESKKVNLSFRVWIVWQDQFM